MDNHVPVIQDFIARKEQILNLEMRLFIIVFAIELIFIIFYIFNYEKLRDRKVISLLALSVFLTLLFEMVAINGKMGLISMYLRQMESYLASIGYQGAIWESRALDKMIFVPGNAFTLPATLTILTLFLQTSYVYYFTCSVFIQSKWSIIVTTAFSSLFTLLIIIKSLTLDFYQKQPELFQF